MGVTFGVSVGGCVPGGWVPGGCVPGGWVPGGCVPGGWVSGVVVLIVPVACPIAIGGEVGSERVTRNVGGDAPAGTPWMGTVIAWLGEPPGVKVRVPAVLA